jgi:hypothetical protein
MKRSFLFLLVIICCSLLNAESISFSGFDKFSFINRDIGEDYKQYFGNELQLQTGYKAFRFGVKYDIFIPKFDRFLGVEQLDLEEDVYEFNEYFVQYESDHLTSTLGIYEAFIGSGMPLHVHYDPDFDEDSRLLGAYDELIFDRWQAQFILGLLENKSDEDEFDRVGAVDFSFDINDIFNIGAAYVKQMTNIIEQDDFNDRNVFSGRLNITTDLFEISSEGAMSKETDVVNDEDTDGHALYSNFNVYADKYTFTGAYKNYLNFNNRISDLPTANYSSEPLSDSWLPGYDEQGVMGEISYIPNYETEVILNYGEGWSSNKEIQQADFYSEFKHEFPGFTFKAEYSHLEQMHDTEFITSWKQELTPSISFDFSIAEFPMLVKAEYQKKTKDEISGESFHYEPKLQMDISYKDYSFSVTTEHEYEDSEDLLKENFWIGAELALMLFHNTDVRFFVGSEKGGKVCRNGVCRYQSEFEGLRLEITTTF